HIGDVLLGHGDNRLLTRSAWVDGLGLGTKAASVFPGNASRVPPLQTAHSVVTLFDPGTGVPSALVDGDLVTRYKTAGDSVLGARFLARPDSERLLVVGAGTVGDSMIDAYSAVFPALKSIDIWNRTAARAQALATKHASSHTTVTAVTDLAAAAAAADMIVCATMTEQPVLLGAWVRPGTHVDVIGAYTPTMREVDDVLISTARIFVDARETAVHDIGELAIPLAAGLITEQDVLGDLYDLCADAPGRQSDADITLYKNGGGGHLDVMTAAYIRSKVEA
ncbi:MAG: ornithine cyclodeaminase family protein, partial [Gammaproteobacteria bacterium]